ncbi:MAG: rhomboid family intramembrane serine protease, partial [Phycisphaerales bacterium]|nr:rhomboid family intramembrane serine protease [Phycisphaerales bacterium]
MATWALLAVNIVVFLAMSAIGRTSPERFEQLQEQAWLNPLNLGMGGVDGAGHDGGATGNDGARDQTPEELINQAMRRVRAAMTGESQIYAKSPDNWGAVTLLTYQFLHAGFLHLIGNMLFLWVFGPAVEDRFGRVGFLLFYLVGGALAGLAHALFEASPVIGASGAIAAVTGAFLVLFPRTHIKVFLFFVMVGVIELPAWIFLALAVAKDLWGLGTHGEGVAFLAHLGGYTVGATVAVALLLTRALPDEDWSLLAVFKQQARRAEFRRLAGEADREWKSRIEKPGSGKSSAPGGARREAATASDAGRSGRGKVGGGVEERVLWQRVEAGEAIAANEKDALRIAAARSELAQRVEAGDAPGAAASLRALLKDPANRGATGSRRVVVAAGNLFTESGRYS